MATMKSRVIEHLQDTLDKFNSDPIQDRLISRLQELGASADLIAQTKANRRAMREELPRLITFVLQNTKNSDTLAAIQRTVGQARFSAEALYAVRPN